MKHLHGVVPADATFMLKIDRAQLTRIKPEEYDNIVKDVKKGIGFLNKIQLITVQTDDTVDVVIRSPLFFRNRCETYYKSNGCWMRYEITAKN